MASVNVTQEVVEFLYKGIVNLNFTQDVVEFLYLPATLAPIYDNVTVTETITFKIVGPIPQNIIDVISATDVITHTFTGIARVYLTQEVIEFLYLGYAHLKLTQNITEILYKSSAYLTTVVDTITADEIIFPVCPHTLTFTDYIFASDRIYIHNLRIEVDDTITIDDYFHRANQNYEITISDNIDIYDTFSQPFLVVIITDIAVVIDAIGPVNSINRQSFIDSVRVTDSFTSLGIRLTFNLGFTDTITVSELIHIPDLQMRSKDIVTILDSIAALIHHTTFTMNDQITVSEFLHANYNTQVVTDIGTTREAIQQLNYTFNDKIIVNEKIYIRRSLYFSDDLTIDDTLVSYRIRITNFIDSLILTDSLVRQFLSTRSFEDILQIGLDYRDFSDPLIGTITIPSLVFTQTGVKGVAKIPSVYLTSASGGKITLPPPEFNDADGQVISTKLQRSITGGTYAFIKNSNRQLMKWEFLVGQLKAIELRAWLVKSMSQTITIVDWTGKTWAGKLTSNPFTFEFQGRWANEVERIKIDLEFQVVNIT